MCTVTYYPIIPGESFILTSNRDEQARRETIPPQAYMHRQMEVTMPKDKASGGSWIAMNKNGKVVCLLNGAFIAHQKEEKHTHSRGKVLLDHIASEEYTQDFFQNQNLKNTEPFTMITIEQKDEKLISFSEFIWDGQDKHFRELEYDKPHIWSSSTLYNEETRRTRKNWFHRFLDKNTNSVSESNLIEFHSGKHTHDETNNVVMERENGIKTVSITQVNNKNGMTMTYFDLQTEKIHKKQLWPKHADIQDTL